MNKIEETEKYMISKVSMDEAVSNIGSYENKYNSKDELRAALKQDGYSDSDINSSIDMIGLKKADAETQKDANNKVEEPKATNETPVEPVNKEVPATNNQEPKPAENPQAVAPSPEQAFANEWSAIQQEVGNIRNSFTALTNDAKAKGYITNSTVLDKIQNVSGVIAGIGSAAAMVGTIMNFIPGMQGVGTALRGAGMLAGGLGTAGNRGAAGVQSWKNGDKKGALANFGMAALGAGTAYMGGKSIGNQIGDLRARNDSLGKTTTPVAPVQNEVPPTQAEVPAGRPVPQGYNDTLKTINDLTGGNQANWTENPAVKNAFTPEQIDYMRNTINTSPEGINQIAMNNAALEQSRLASDASSMQNQYLDHANVATNAQATAQNMSNNYANTANNLQNKYDNTQWVGGGREMAGRDEYAANLKNDIAKNNNLAGSYRGIANSFANQADNYMDKSNLYGDAAKAYTTAANTNRAGYNRGLKYR